MIKKAQKTKSTRNKYKNLYFQDFSSFFNFCVNATTFRLSISLESKQTQTEARKITLSMS